MMRRAGLSRKSQSITPCKIWKGRGEGVVWTTQEPKDFAASSYWRNLAAHDRGKIVQLFQCTLGVGQIIKLLQKNPITNSHNL